MFLAPAFIQQAQDRFFACGEAALKGDVLAAQSRGYHATGNKGIV